jgi:hypothetical protein
VVTTSDGAWRSNDDGAHWPRLDRHSVTHRFTSAHWANGYLYLATYGQGILRSNERLN